MSKIVYDTSVFIAYRPALLSEGTFLSAVVMQELTAGADSRSALKAIESVRIIYGRAERLLVPTSEDWWLAGKVLYSLLHGLRSKAGELPRLPAEEKQRIIRDVLIARTSKRVGATIVTNNLRDFQRIRPYCAVRVIAGSDYFN
jgi:predicted nucleic acid-binding protein